MTRGGGDADLILTGGRVITLDAASSIAEAVAIRGDRILATSTDEEIGSRAGPDTQRIDLVGRAVIPGIIDAHAHMEREGLKAVRPSLSGATSVADILSRIAAEAGLRPPGDWIVTMPVGEPPHYFDPPSMLAEKRMPTRHELDRAAPDHPVCIMAAFGHWGAPPCYWVLNSRALALNGVNAATKPAFDEIEIEKDPATGEPTGIIIEHSRHPIAPFDILRAVPRFTFEERRAGLAESMKLYNAVGTTGVYEGHGSAPETIAAYRELWEADALTVRARLTVSPTWRDVEEAGRMMRDGLAWARGRGFGDRWLGIAGVFVGLLGDTAQRDCALDALPDTGWSGFVEPASSLEDYRALAHLCATSDLRLHSIVSRRMDTVIPILEEVDAAHCLAPRRWIVEHIDVVEPHHVAALRRLGVLVTCIPSATLWRNGGRHLARPDGGARVLPLRDLNDAGVPCAAGTDNIPYNPFFTLWAMLTRTPRGADQAIAPEQRLTVEQGLRALTTAGARLSFEEDARGSIEPGKLADLAVLDADPTRVPVEEIGRITAAMTVVDGRIVHATS